jgi:serine/threonine protein kinase
VRVVTACSQPDFHALVLPLMPNGSLESRLYPPDGAPGRGLDLAQLVSIASDVAEGLAYLHHYAPVRVVHCDLKPSNVLLDDDMTAVVADFGIARLVKDVGGDSDDLGSTAGSADPCNSITGLLQGSVGYIAPGTESLLINQVQESKPCHVRLLNIFGTLCSCMAHQSTEWEGTHRRRATCTASA